MPPTTINVREEVADIVEEMVIYMSF
jgi:hypothetical protein